MADRPHGSDPIDRAPLPPELVAERKRIQRLAADADRRAERGRLRRRALLPAAVASGVLVGTGLVSAWARTTTPATGSATQQSASRSAAAAASSEQAFLHELQRTLQTDEQTIAALPQVAANSLAASAASSAPASSSASASPGVSPAPIASLPSISLPAISAPPPVQATTGASGLG